ncbi:YkgJ family cysteine cluster protein [Desulfogranum mediterraneum]|uniref:YkgJ family cysteine cluster protein n=1 Tax=Desulfogranum mediterraneum TaxID=160661 RepID=UPI00041ABFCC|nr:YkgJ family cysteine cluster protein [Desulfogranum mediterraneum]
MIAKTSPEQAELRTLFAECRQCGTCCRSFRKIALHPDEVEFIKKMGGHVGVDIGLNELREQSMEELVEAARARGRLFMIHPDDQGCVFLERRNERYVCRIYHHRPRVCRGFRCTLADSSFLDLFGGDAIHLLGQDRFGLPLAPPHQGEQGG